MSINYANGLSKHPNKGVLGNAEVVDPPRKLYEKLVKLADLFKKSKSVVVVTGAGISTAAGIPDFRGPNGVWTKESRNEPIESIDFDKARPTYTHFALATLCKIGKIKHLVSQNVDNLHLRSDFPIDRLFEIHGNSFKEVCPECKSCYFSKKAVPTCGLKPTGNICSMGNCRAALIDSVLDWNSEISPEYFTHSIPYAKSCDLLLILGSSMQIRPIGLLPRNIRMNKKATVVYVNLQTIRSVSYDLAIHAQCDDAMRFVMDAMRTQVQGIVREIEMKGKFPLTMDVDVVQSPIRRKTATKKRVNRRLGGSTATKAKTKTKAKAKVSKKKVAAEVVDVKIKKCKLEPL